MRIGAAQLRPVAGDVASNLAKHLELIDVAAALGADLVYFPELSLTGYEPGSQNLSPRMRETAASTHCRSVVTHTT
jgi:predicted amidohydrolase